MIDPEIFTRAVGELLRSSGGYAFSLLRDRGDAEDAVQQTALRAWERRAQFNARYSFKAWWFAILRNRCMDQLRARKWSANSVRIDDVELPRAPDETAFDRHILNSAMEKLPKLHREVLTLRYFADMSYEELALVLGIPKGTVMSRLHIARKALAHLINTQEQP